MTAHGAMTRGVQDLPVLMQAFGFVNLEFRAARVPMLGMVRGVKGE